MATLRVPPDLDLYHEIDELTPPWAEAGTRSRG